MRVVRHLIPWLAISCASLGCSRSDATLAANESGDSSSASPREAERGEAEPLTGDPDLDSEASLTRGLEYDSGRVVIDEAAARSVVAVEDKSLAATEFVRAEQLYSQNYFRDAVTSYGKAVLLDRKNPRMYEGLGKCFIARRAGKEAVASFRTALDLDPHSVDLRYELGDALIRVGEREAALAQFDEVISSSPKRVDAHQRAATQHYYLHDYAAAWREVHATEDLGAGVPPQFRRLLQGVMAEPAR